MKRIRKATGIVLILALLGACGQKTENSAPAAQTPGSEESAAAYAEAETVQPESISEAQQPAETVPVLNEFLPSEIHDLVSAQIFGEYGEIRIDDREKLEWIEEHFSQAVKLNGWPNCPYESIIRLERADGALFEVQPSTDSCTNLKAGEIWYRYGTDIADNKKLFELFGLTTEFGGVKKIASLPEVGRTAAIER